MRPVNGFNDHRVLDAFCDMQVAFSRDHPVWLEASVLLLLMTNDVKSKDVVGVERTLRRLKREKLLQQKVFKNVAYYSLTKSARDKYLEE